MLYQFEDEGTWEDEDDDWVDVDEVDYDDGEDADYEVVGTEGDPYDIEYDR